MYAVIRDGSKQFRVEPQQIIEIERTGLEPGSTYSFDVLAIAEDDGTLRVGQPVVKGATVTGEVIAEVKQEKLIVFKFRRRKASRVKTGHRQRKTSVRITDVTAPKA